MYLSVWVSLGIYHVQGKAIILCPSAFCIIPEMSMHKMKVYAVSSV